MFFFRDYLFSCFYFFRGALTDKVYGFDSRCWEFRDIGYYDIFDTFLVELSINFIRNKILRIVPSLRSGKTFYNFISDKTRFFFDGVFIYRLSSCFIRRKNDTSLYTNTILPYLISLHLLLCYKNLSKIKILIKELVKRGSYKNIFSFLTLGTFFNSCGFLDFNFSFTFCFCKVFWFL